MTHYSIKIRDGRLDNFVENDNIIPAERLEW